MFRAQMMQYFCHDDLIWRTNNVQTITLTCSVILQNTKQYKIEGAKMCEHRPR